jgi:hypothetical protein
VSSVAKHANQSAPTFGPLTPQTKIQAWSDNAPVMATPAAVAGGVTVVGAGFGAGWGVGEIGD